MKLTGAHVEFQSLLGPSWRCFYAIIWKSAHQTVSQILFFPFQPKWSWKSTITVISFHLLSPSVIYLFTYFTRIWMLPAQEEKSSRNCCSELNVEAERMFPDETPPLGQEFGGNSLWWSFYKGNQCQSRPWNSARDRNKMWFLKIADCICNLGAQYVAALWGKWISNRKTTLSADIIEPRVFGESFGWLCLTSACLPCLHQETCEMTPAHREDGHKLLQSHFPSRIYPSCWSLEAISLRAVFPHRVTKIMKAFYGQIWQPRRRKCNGSYERPLIVIIGCFPVVFSVILQWLFWGYKAGLADKTNLILMTSDWDKRKVPKHIKASLIQTVMVGFILKGRCCPHVYKKSIAVYEMKTDTWATDDISKQKSDLNLIQLLFFRAINFNVLNVVITWRVTT